MFAELAKADKQAAPTAAKLITYTEGKGLAPMDRFKMLAIKKGQIEVTTHPGGDENITITFVRYLHPQDGRTWGLIEQRGKAAVYYAVRPEALTARGGTPRTHAFNLYRAVVEAVAGDVQRAALVRGRR